MKTARILVWDLPVRVFHWVLVLCFAGAWITAESERFRDLHLLFGYTMAGLVGLRLLWGLVGTRYARFASFVAGPGRVLRYAGSLLRAAPEHHVGHNPAGAWAIIGLLALIGLTALTGHLNFNDMGGRWMEDVHEIAANSLMALVVVHLGGVLVSSLLHRENLVRSMITGEKRGEAADGIRSSHRFVAMLLACAVIGFWIAAWNGAVPGVGGADAGSVQTARSDGRED